MFRFVTKQFCLFRLFRYRFETPKQTEIFCFWFHETNRNCFGLFRFEPKIIFVCFEDTLGRGVGRWDWGVGGGEARGRIKGVEGGGVRGFFTALEGLVRVGEQCGNITLPHSSPPWSISGLHMCMHTYR
jgi:hypothetical protein